MQELADGVYKTARYSNTWASLWEAPLSGFKNVYFTDRAVDFIESVVSGSEPFALFVNIWAPYPPLTVPEPYASLFDPERLELPENVGLANRDEPANRRKGVPAQLAEGVTPDAWRKTWAAHLGLTRLADDCIGRIIETLKRAGKYEQTLILFMSDHGDQLGQHRMYQKMEMYEQAIHVPMLIKLPSSPAGQIDQVVSHLDIVPTLFDVLQMPVPSDMDGISLRACLTEGAPLPDRAVFSQYSGNPAVGDIRRAMITETYKYIYDPNWEAELFNLKLDPLELANLASDPAHRLVLNDMHAQLIQWAQAHGDPLE